MVLLTIPLSVSIYVKEYFNLLVYETHHPPLQSTYEMI